MGGLSNQFCTIQVPVLGTQIAITRMFRFG